MQLLFLSQDSKFINNSEKLL